jgi:heptosyltransferase-3
MSGMVPPRGGRVLAVRLDNAGDVLLVGPAVRALAASADAVDLLVSPAGEQAARLLPGVDRVLVFDPPWSGYRPPPVSAPAVRDLVALLAAGEYRRAVVFTSFHQSPLPVALLAKLAGIPFVAADSVDYPGSLLDLRHSRNGGHEVDAALALARAAGGLLPPGDCGRLAVLRPLPDLYLPLPAGPYVVVHPGASVPARAPAPGQVAGIVAALRAAGWPVVLTGAPTEHALADRILSDPALSDPRAADPVLADRPPDARDLDGWRAGWGRRDPGLVSVVGRTGLAGLGKVLEGAACVVVGNTGPAHLAAAVGTPVVSLFAPVCRPSGGRCTGCRAWCWATSGRAAGTAGPGTARCPVIRA